MISVIGIWISVLIIPAPRYIAERQGTAMYDWIHCMQELVFLFDHLKHTRWPSVFVNLPRIGTQAFFAQWCFLWHNKLKCWNNLFSCQLHKEDPCSCASLAKTGKLQVNEMSQNYQTALPIFWTETGFIWYIPNEDTVANNHTVSFSNIVFLINKVFLNLDNWLRQEEVAHNADWLVGWWLTWIISRVWTYFRETLIWK